MKNPKETPYWCRKQSGISATVNRGIGCGANETATMSQETDDRGMRRGVMLYVYVCCYCDRWVQFAPGGGKCT